MGVEKRVCGKQCKRMQRVRMYRIIAVRWGTFEGVQSG